MNPKDASKTDPDAAKPAASSAPAVPAGPAPAGAAEPDYYDQLLRLKAEFENYRKRVDRDRPEWIRLGRAGLLDKLLPLYDLLLQAHDQVVKAPAAGASPDIVKGLELIFKEFTRMFAAEGVMVIEAAGKPFHHDLHEVVGFVETSEKADGEVLEELQRGYTLDGKVLRPARVRIAKNNASGGKS